VVDHVGTAVVLDFADEQVVLHPRGVAIRASDGRLLGNPVVTEMRGMAQNTYALDRATNTVFFGVGGHSGFEKWNGQEIGKARCAVRLTLSGDQLSGALLWKKEGSFGDQTATFWRGKIYTGGFVVDAATGEEFSKHPSLATSQGWVIAGNRLWGGTCHENPCIQSAPIGPDGRVGAIVTNLIGKLDGFTAEEGARMNAYGGYGIGKWYGWTIGRNYPCFSGNRIFIRTFDHLYAIGDQTQPFTPSAASVPAP
jgi:hypothetical protein